MDAPIKPIALVPLAAALALVALSGTAGAYRGYAAHKIGDAAYAGFWPEGVDKSGYFELYSKLLESESHPIARSTRQSANWLDDSGKQS